MFRDHGDSNDKKTENEMEPGFIEEFRANYQYCDPGFFV